MTKICSNCGTSFALNPKGHHAKRCPACKRVYNLEYKAQYKLLAGKFCDCGQPATTYYSGERCCDRCKTIDQRNDEIRREMVKAKAEQMKLETELSRGWTHIGRMLDGQFGAMNQFNEQ